MLSGSPDMENDLGELPNNVYISRQLTHYAEKERFANVNRKACFLDGRPTLKTVFARTVLPSSRRKQSVGALKQLHCARFGVCASEQCADDI